MGVNDPYEIIRVDGVKLDRMTAQAVSQMETRLGRQLRIMQGSYNQGGVAASAGTHDGGGAVDLSAADWERTVRVGRDVGFAMWRRTPAEGPWGEHIHGILIGNVKASAGAKRQVVQYKAGLNGLASRRRDPFPYRPNPIKNFIFRLVPTYGISLAATRVDFINALEGGRNPSRFRGKVIQRLLNRKNGEKLLVDGIIGRQTVAAWYRWETRVGGSDVRPRVPDQKSLSILFRNTIFFVKK